MESMDTGKEMSKLARTGEVAKALGVHPETIRRWALNGKLAAAKHPVSGCLLFQRETVASLLRSLEFKCEKKA